ncbi:MAG: hypothetical protein ACKOC4_02865 [Planctomycetia bacterium]
MPRLPHALRRRAARGLLATAAAVLIASLAAECPAIEMFTFFGDGSRIGLPSLEVPVEAYPGIPLRSDRIRARRAGRRGIPPTAAAPAQPGLPRGITIREMPAAEPAAAQPRMQPAARRSRDPEMPMPPSPEDIVPGPVRPPLAE